MLEKTSLILEVADYYKTHTARQTMERYEIKSEQAVRNIFYKVYRVDKRTFRANAIMEKILAMNDYESGEYRYW